MIEDMHHAHDQARPAQTGTQEPASTTEQRFALGTWLRSRSGLVLLGFLAVAGFYLVTEHTAHLLGILPYAIFLACPLMMLFMHGGHGGHMGHGDHTTRGGKE
jgi:hypothetical protein